MSISAAMLPEFDQEILLTRKTLERVPAARLDFKPHEKSMTLGSLANHIVNMPYWGSVTLEFPEMDIMPGGAPLPSRAKATVEEMLTQFDENAATMRTLLAATTDEAMAAPWSLIGNGHIFFTLPRVAVLRSTVMNHMIHHRAQLGVYLRLLDVPLPALYGPSADERNM